ncbi:hypothetical protein, partial [Acinetobacter soli]|uniref:hypothetical protein n=1 Tax=Acinetobacter soli TaxID=487316 RepID=UPI00300C5FBA
VVLANLAIGALSGAFFSGDFASQVNALVGLVLLVGVSGGVPIAVGGGLIWWGRSLQKGRQPD